MAYWFENPTLKALAPLALSTSIKGLTTIFNVPKMFIGSNVFPEGPVVGPSTMDTLANRCAKQRAFIVTDEFGNKFAAKAARFLQSGGFTVEIWPRCLPEAPMEVVAECAKAMKAYEPDLIMAVGGGSVMDSAKAAWILYERPDITELGMISPLDKLNLRKKALLAAVPTTSGTGSECTGAARCGRPRDGQPRRVAPTSSPDPDAMRHALCAMRSCESSEGGMKNSIEWL